MLNQCELALFNGGRAIMFKSLDFYRNKDGKPIYLYEMLPQTNIFKLALKHWKVSIFSVCGKKHTTWDLLS